MNVIEIFRAFCDMLYPCHCAVCDTALTASERFLCLRCLQEVPLTRLHKKQFNIVEQLFAGKVPIEKASGIFYYSKGSPYDKILYDIKYHNNPELAKYLAELFSAELLNDGFFKGIDYIVPIPLHRKKFAHRGYNQSEYVAAGFSKVSGIPVINALTAVREHATQTHKNAHERYLNTRNLFAVSGSYTIKDKHILIVDDVVTTGSTIESAATALRTITGVRCSVLTLAVAHNW